MLLAFSGSCGSDQPSLLDDCVSFCEHWQALDCDGSGSQGYCRDDCQYTIHGSDPDCRPQLSSMMSCLAVSRLSCAPCPEATFCPSSVVPEGCDQPIRAYADCAGLNECTDYSGPGGIVNDEGRVVYYDVSIDCFDCPPGRPGGDAPGTECTEARDCSAICCDCNDQTALVSACLDGVCAEPDSACSDLFLQCERTGPHE